MRLTLAVDAGLAEVAEIQQKVTAFGEAEQWPPDMAFQVELTLEEICINIVNYGFELDGNEHSIEVIVDSEPDMLAMEIIDNGRAFDPLTETPDPDLDASIDDRRVGGLGVYFVKQYMDELQYRRESGRNHLKMVKHRG